MIRPRSIVFASGDFWASPMPMCSHQLARAFARAGWSVAFVSGPITPLHFLPGAARNMRARSRLWRQGGVRAYDGRLWAFVPFSLVAPTGRRGMRGDWVQRNWWRHALPRVATSLGRAGFAEADVLCFDAPTHAHLLRAVPHRRSVLRVVDKLSALPWHGAARDRALRQLAGEVDLVTYTAAALRDYVEGMAPRRHALLANGVDFERFAAPQAPPPEYAAIPRPRAVYVGNLARWFDYTLFERVAATLPEVSFVLVGPTDVAHGRLSPRANVHLIGTRPHEAVPGYLQHADAGLIPYDVHQHSEQVNAINPLKLYEYLACGLPVVAVDWDEMRTLASPARLCAGADSFAATLRHVISAPPDRNEARRFAAARDWSAVAARLVDLLELG